jgi:hypothetical protein
MAQDVQWLLKGGMKYRVDVYRQTDGLGIGKCICGAAEIRFPSLKG